MGLVFFLISWVLLLPLGVLNWFYVKNKRRYFIERARNVDIFGNVEFKALFNELLITKNGYKFGVMGETISSVLGKNLRGRTLTRFGKNLAWLITYRHCIESIDNNF
jgi:hypothetical protein